MQSMVKSENCRGWDAEEGEISDSDLMQEADQKEFRRREAKRAILKKSKRDHSRVRPIRDFCGFRFGGGYIPGLYNLAWAQSVKNKPAGELFVRYGSEESFRSPVNSSSANRKAEEENKSQSHICQGDDTGNKLDVRAADVEKEDGELEEGEIDMDSELIENVTSNAREDGLSDNVENADASMDIVSEVRDLESKKNIILELLRAITSDEAATEFKEVCCKLNRTLESLQEMVMERENCLGSIDNLRQSSFNAIQIVHSAFASMNVKAKELNKDSFTRLVAPVINHDPPFLFADHVQEVRTMLFSVTSPTVSLASSANKMEQENCDKSSSTSESMPSGLTNVKQSVASLPLLDLHKDHDLDHLPSPTREKGSVCERREFVRLMPTVYNSDGHPYEKEALRAFSSYQQKFVRSSFYMSDKLPSPTPSEESDDGDATTVDETSNMSNGADSKTTEPVVFRQPAASPSFLEKSLLAAIDTDRDPATVGPGLGSMAKPSAKSRDPRLRISNSNDMGGNMSSRKHKSSLDSIFSGPSQKRQKNTMENKSCGGWLEDVDGGDPQTTSPIGGNPRRMTVSTSNNLLSFPADASEKPERSSVSNILNDIIVNPTMLLNILKMGGQQDLALEVQQKLAELSRNACRPSVSSLQLSSNVPKQEGIINGGSQMASNEKEKKIVMKPRDPRRVLHINVAQSCAPPDIASMFTNSLNNIANLVSASQVQTPSPPSVAQNQAAQTLQVKFGGTTMEDEAMIADQENRARLLHQEGGMVGCCSQNNWGDVDHLLDGYDEQQKAAIQRERLRRIKEQKKLFSMRKLCLVLDLDHTLLNSAKFLEVDPVHDEILRKKEELDREKAQRHLFRFPHMAMWTKLRPGIWKFLEKASKLFELHLYTMGNNLYATEMAKVLDPTGLLFGGRVISKGDDGDPFDTDDRVTKTKDLEGVLGMESGVVIIDDSARVWPHNKLNLIIVERYIYFPCSRRQFGLLGPSLLEIDHDERSEDGTLASSLAVIERIHKIFFGHQSLEEADVRNILASEQRKILSGCRVLFSRVFPVGEANPHLHPLWQIAEQFGAVCTNQLDEHVTHVVAHSLGTDKVNWALSTRRFVVHPGWVEASALLYRRANEQDFFIKPAESAPINTIPDKTPFKLNI